jgi:hypothetical protein
MRSCGRLALGCVCKHFTLAIHTAMHLVLESYEIRKNIKIITNKKAKNAIVKCGHSKKASKTTHKKQHKSQNKKNNSGLSTKTK